MVRHDGISADIDGEYLTQPQQSILNPLAAMFVANPGEGINSTQKRPTDTTGTQ
ncbi:hypothetical protein [Gynuella sunshinyii]|uniref:hypothetical protein n=1 Tax=Gynuella sunshinyii TaxID=1445505 RepID=UPI001B800201|nr:hypothetical protein [Gynuella sunshinyii]